jgi:hypothetical protein
MGSAEGASHFPRIRALDVRMGRAVSADSFFDACRDLGLKPQAGMRCAVGTARERSTLGALVGDSLAWATEMTAASLTGARPAP